MLGTTAEDTPFGEGRSDKSADTCASLLSPELNALDANVRSGLGADRRVLEKGLSSGERPTVPRQTKHGEFRRLKLVRVRLTPRETLVPLWRRKRVGSSSAPGVREKTDRGPGEFAASPGEGPRLEGPGIATTGEWGARE